MPFLNQERRFRLRAESSLKSSSTNSGRAISSYLFVLLLVTILLNYPWVVWGLVPGQDSGVHLQYFHSFNEQLRGGELYPRWLTSMNDRAGSPIFFIQYPLPYFVASAFHYLLHLPLTLAGESHALGLVFFFSAMFLNASLFLWCSRLVDRPSAAMAAVSGLMLPYVLWFDFYHRNALGECTALACIPLALYFCHDLDEHPRRAVSGIALSFGLLFSSHIFSVVMFLPFLALYVLVITSSKSALRSLILTTLGTVLGAGLAGVYLLPMLAHRQYFDLGGLVRWAGGNYLYDNQLFPLNSFVYGSRPSGCHILTYHQNCLLESGWWFLSWLTRLGALCLVVFAVQRLRKGSIEHVAHRFLVVITLLLVIFSVGAPLFGAHTFYAHVDQADNWFIVQRSQIFGFALLTLELALIAFLALPKQSYQRLPAFLLGGVLMSFLLMTRWTVPLWGRMHFLWSIQFPWRFFGLLSIFTTGLIALLVQAILRNGGWRNPRLLLTCCVFAGIVLLGAADWADPAIFFPTFRFSGKVFHHIPDRPQEPTDIALSTYLHATELANQEHPWRADSPAEETRILQGTGSVRLQTIAARRRVLEVDCSVPCMTQVHLLYYPGWLAHDLTGASVTLQASPENGLIELTLPSGYHRIQLELPRDSAERLGPWVSFLSFGMLLIVANPCAMGFSRFIARIQRS